MTGSRTPLAFTTFSDPTTSTESLSYLWLHMNQGQDTLKLASSSRPSCTTKLHALPVELLAYIFSLCTQVPDEPDRYLPHPHWMAITHVCHYWRTITLNHASLWASVTCGLPLYWIKLFMERSQKMPMNFDLDILPYNHEGIILLLSDFSRIHSLCLTGYHYTIHPILDSLCSPLPVHSLYLHLEDEDEDLPDWGHFTLSDNLFGGNAPIRRLQFHANCPIVSPHWLLRGVTHFTSSEPISPSELLDVLGQMPALTHFDFHPLSYNWRKLDVDLSPIHMPRLTNLIVHSRGYPRAFLKLYQLLSLQPGAKRRLEIQPSKFSGLIARLEDWTGLSPLLEAAGGFQHIQVSGHYKEGRYRIWTGSPSTTWEDAEFCLFAEWGQTDHYWITSKMASRFVDVCGALDVAQVRRLVVNLTAIDRGNENKQNDLSVLYWWGLLEKLPGIEELELYPTGVGAPGGGAWEVSTVPAVLPALRRVRIVVPELDNPSLQYAIIGDPPARRIVRLPNSTLSDITSFPEAISAEKEIENLSSALLQFLQGVAAIR